MQRATRKHTGFTIVELLIVIVVIAILAAVTIVAYNGVSNRAKIVSVQSDLAQAYKKLEMIETDSQSGTYPSVLPTSIKGSRGTNYDYTYIDGVNGYCLKASNAGIDSFVTSARSKIKDGTCSVTNLATNPSIEVNTTTWSGGGGTANMSMNRLANTSLYGNYVINHLITSGGSSSYLYNKGPNVTAGTSYTASVSFRPIYGLRTVKANIVWRAADGSPLGQVDGTGQTPQSTSDVVRVSVSGVAPNGASYMQLQCLVQNPQTGDSYFWDGSFITSGSDEYDYVDPSLSSTWAWTGTPHESTSTGPPL